MIGGAFLDAVTDVARLRAVFRQHELEKDDEVRRMAERIDKRKTDAAAEANNTGDFLQVLVIASVLDARLQELAERTNTHQLAVIEALQNNRDRLDVVEDRIDTLLGEAYVLEDGRRVFKTEDGIRVFDEFGAELDGDDIDPDRIGRNRPSWETYEAETRKRDRLQTERDELLDYQEKLDRAQEKLEAGAMTREDADDLDDLLNNNVPDAVRPYLPDIDPSNRRADLAPGTALADDLDLDGAQLGDATLEADDSPDLT